jgi:hypothetical protein
MQMVSGPPQIISPAVADINFGILALKTKTGHFKKRGKHDKYENSAAI